MAGARSALTLLSVVSLAGFAGVPVSTGPVPEGPNPTVSVEKASQPPVPIIRTKSKKLIAPPFGDAIMRYTLTGADSYDPDGYIVRHHWSTSCYPQPEAPGTEYSVDVAWGESCQVTLFVTDDSGAMSYTIVTYSF